MSFLKINYRNMYLLRALRTALNCLLDDDNDVLSRRKVTLQLLLIIHAGCVFVFVYEE